LRILVTTTKYEKIPCHIVAVVAPRTMASVLLKVEKWYTTLYI